MAASLTPFPRMPGTPEHAPVNILLVDDQPARLLTYRAILEPLGERLVDANSSSISFCSASLPELASTRRSPSGSRIAR